MSLCFWPIIGCGLAVTEDLVDLNKATDLLATQDLTPDEASIYDFLYALSEEKIPRMGGIHRYLCISSEGEMGDECYLYLPSYFPWEVTGDLASLTPEDVAEAIADVLEPYLADGVTREDVKKHICEISSVGCG